MVTIDATLRHAMAWLPQIPCVSTSQADSNSNNMGRINARCAFPMSLNCTELDTTPPHSTPHRAWHAVAQLMIAGNMMYDFMLNVGMRSWISRQYIPALYCESIAADMCSTSQVGTNAHNRNPINSCFAFPGGISQFQARHALTQRSRPSLACCSMHDDCWSHGSLCTCMIKHL